MTFDFKPYTREEFLEVAQQVITGQHGKDPALARYIARRSSSAPETSARPSRSRNCVTVRKRLTGSRAACMEHRNSRWLRLTQRPIQSPCPPMIQRFSGPSVGPWPASLPRTSPLAPHILPVYQHTPSPVGAGAPQAVPVFSQAPSAPCLVLRSPTQPHHHIGRQRRGLPH